MAGSLRMSVLRTTLTHESGLSSEGAAVASTTCHMHAWFPPGASRPTFRVHCPSLEAASQGFPEATNALILAAPEALPITL